MSNNALKAACWIIRQTINMPFFSCYEHIILAAMVNETYEGKLDLNVHLR